MIEGDVLERAGRELPGLGEMLAEAQAVGENGALTQPSRFWEHHNEQNLRQIADRGFAEFKRTVNANYFQWEPGSPRDDDARARVARRLLRLWSGHPDPRVLGARLLDPRTSLHSGAGARWHAICVAMLWEEARRRDQQQLLEGREEPALGGTVQVAHRGRLITEDLANSALELAAIAEGGGLPSPGSLVVELGAGYGRLLWLLLEAVPGLRCIVCDIPPALAIAQRYLTGLFPELPVFRFRRFDGAADAAELRAARLAFLMPHQLASLPPLEADLFVNISSLHEMLPEQVAAWFELIDRHTRGRFYTKQWIESVNVFDELVMHRRDYPVPAGWRVLLDREVRTTPGFFETVFSVGSAPHAANLRQDAAAAGGP